MNFLDMTDSDRKALVLRTLDPTDTKTKERRKAISQRVACLEERPDEVAKERIKRIFVDSEIAEHVCRYTSAVWNPLSNICELIAQGYANAPIRRLQDKTAEAALLKFLEGPTRFSAKAKAWNLQSVALNTIIILVVPKTRRGKSCFDFRVINGSQAEVVQDPEAPFGDTPAILAYAIHRPEDRHREPQRRRDDEPYVVVVDAYGYHQCNAQGEVLDTKVHGLDRFPGAVLRCGDPSGHDDNDWWNYRRNRALVDGTAQYGEIGATCAWGRKTQWGKLITISRDGNDTEDPVTEEGQTAGPEGVLDVANADVKVQDFEAPIDGFLKHQAAVLHETARRVTGSSKILDDQPLQDAEIAQRHAVLLQHQRDQHAYLGPFERDLFEVMAEIGERYGVEGFPTLAQLESLDIQFVPLTMVSSPEKRLKFYEEATKFGTSTPVKMLMEDGWSEDDAFAEVIRNVEVMAEINEIRTKRMSAADPTKIPGDAVTTPTAEPDPAKPGERPEAATGRVGGRASPPPTEQEE